MLASVSFKQARFTLLILWTACNISFRLTAQHCCWTCCRTIAANRFQRFMAFYLRSMRSWFLGYLTMLYRFQMMWWTLRRTFLAMAHARTHVHAKRACINGRPLERDELICEQINRNSQQKIHINGLGYLSLVMLIRRQCLTGCLLLCYSQGRQRWRISLYYIWK